MLLLKIIQITEPLNNARFRFSIGIAIGLGNGDIDPTIFGFDLFDKQGKPPLSIVSIILYPDPQLYVTRLWVLSAGTLWAFAIVSIRTVCSRFLCVSSFFLTIFYCVFWSGFNEYLPTFPGNAALCGKDTRYTSSVSADFQQFSSKRVELLEQKDR